MHHYLQVIPPQHVIIILLNGVQNSDTISEGKSKFISPMGIHLQSKHNYRNVFGNSKKQYPDFNNGDALTFKD